MKRASQDENTDNGDTRSYESLWMADYIIEKLYSRLDSYNYSREIDNRLPNYVSQKCTTLIQSIANLKVSQCDIGESSGLDMRVHNWDISIEPPSTFVRSSIILTKVFAAPTIKEICGLTPVKKLRSKMSVMAKKSTKPIKKIIEDKKVCIYEIKPPEVDKETERIVEELRAKQKVEEIKLNEARNLEMQAKKRLKQMRDKRKQMQENGIDFQSYDINGNIIELQSTGEFPYLIPKCKLNINNKKEKNLDENTSIPLLTRTKLLSKRMASPATTFLKDNERLYMKGLYNSLVPSAGVRFSENGQNPKVSGMSMSKQLGQISKLDFHSMLSSSTSQYQLEPGLPIIYSSKTEAHSRTSELSNSLSTPELTGPVSTNIPVDISQLLTENSGSKNRFRLSSCLRSIIPRIQIPSLQKTKQNLSTKDLNFEPNEFDRFNSNLLDGYESVIKTKLKPIVKAEKLVFQGLKYRERNFPKQKPLKLPPPPIGKTKGHGIISATQIKI